MNNSVTIDYPIGSNSQIMVSYAIEVAEGIQTINCSIQNKTSPFWLQLRKFSVSSVEKLGNYTALFNEINNSKNLDTSLFIDLVYSSIMKAEHFRHS